MELATLTIKKAAELYRTRQLSPLELVELFLKRIEVYNPRLNCYLTITEEIAKSQAKKAMEEFSRSSSMSILHGIPLAFKDLYEIKGVRTTAGSKVFQDYIPAQDSEVARRVFTAGGVLLGKLNMHEIALGVTNVNPHYGPCRNPWNPDLISGGSSGGCAAALAAGLCLGAFGSDTGGSIRIPASLCGIVGLKPTFGRVSLRGVIPLSWNLDHGGPMARTVEDVAILLNCIAGYDGDDPGSIEYPVENYLEKINQGIKGWRVALASDAYFSQADNEVLAAIQGAAKTFENLGANVETIELSGAREAALANGLIVTSDAFAYHRERLNEHPEDFGADVTQRLRAGKSHQISDYILARREQVRLRRQFEKYFEQYDIFLTPTTPITAPPIEGDDAVSQAPILTRFTAPFNLSGLPALSLPCGFDSRGLPVGLQIISAPWQEAKLLRAAYTYEQAANLQNRKPAL